MFDIGTALTIQGTEGPSDALLRFVAEEIPVGIAVLEGVEHRVRYANRAYRLLAGDPSADLIGRTIRDIFPLIPPQGLGVLDAVYATGDPQHIKEFEARFLPGSDVTFWDASHYPLRGEAGRIVALAIVANNVTDKVLARREAEQRAAEAEAAKRLLDGLMRYVPEGITIAEPPDVKILRVSEYGRNLTGRSHEELEGIPADDHVARWDILCGDGVTVPDPAELPLTRATIEGEVVVSERWALRSPTGQTVPILCNAGPILDEQGKIRYGVIAWRDISRLVETENALKAAVAEKEVLVQEVNHRVKNSLQLVSSLITLQGMSVSDPKAREVLGTVSERVSVVARIHERLYRAGATDRLDFGAFLRELSTDLVQSMARPDAVEPPVIDADPLELGADVALPLALIASELITNSLKYAYPGGAGPIEVTLRNQDTGLLMSIGDRGLGLPEGFDLQAGTGLGMRVVRAFVRQLGGEIKTRDQMPGTCFEVTVPAQRLARGER